MASDGDHPPDKPAAEPGVPHAVFSVEGLPARQRYEIWRDSISCIFEVDAARPTRTDGFTASVDAHMFGPVMLARTRTLEQTWLRSPAITARDGMDHYMIQFYESGHMACEHRGGTTEMPTNGLMVFDLAEWVSTRTDNFSNISLIVPRRMIEGLLKRPHDQHMRTLTAEEPMVALLRDHMLSLKQLAPRMTAEQALEIAPATAGLAAACLNGSVDDISLGAGRPTLRSTMAMDRCRRFIDAHISSPDLSPDTIAAAVGMSRTQLYRLFEPHGGVAHHVRERRLRMALLALADRREDGRPIYDIALACGFSSDASFSRMFRERYGVAPRDVRNGAAVRATPAGEAGQDIDRRYETWLNRLAI